MASSQYGKNTLEDLYGNGQIMDTSDKNFHYPLVFGDRPIDDSERQSELFYNVLGVAFHRVQQEFKSRLGHAQKYVEFLKGVRVTSRIISYELTLKVRDTSGLEGFYNVTVETHSGPKRPPDFKVSCCRDVTSEYSASGLQGNNPKMSVVGFDFGNGKGVVAVARQKLVQVLCNDLSQRETPTVVCFTEKQRLIGTAGAATIQTNPENTISQIKRLIGRPFSDPELQRDIKGLPFSVREGPDGFPLIHVRYMGEQRSFTPTQIMGMVFSNLKGTAEKNLYTVVDDCCIGIPVYFTDLQRRAVLDAATIAGLRPLRLMHETTSTALTYGIFYQKNLPENDHANVAFVDIGHSSMQVCIARFEEAQLRVLAHSFDRCLGGRDFDEALFNHFGAIFQDEHHIDISQNAGACNKLRAACEKLKKKLTANSDASFKIKHLIEDKGIRGFIKCEDLQIIFASIINRVKSTLRNALTESGLSVDDIHPVEVVGSGSLVPAVSKTLTDFFGKDPRRTMKANSSVSRGCAIQCAKEITNINMRKLQVNDILPYSISLSWKDSDGASESQQSTVLFPKGSPIPSVRPLMLRQSGIFSVDVLYDDPSELQVPTKISTYTIGPFQAPTGEMSNVRLKVRLNVHGIVSIETATLLEEGEVDIPVAKQPSKEAVKMETDDDTTNNTASSDLTHVHGIVSIETATLLEEGEVDVPVAKQPSKEAVKMETDDETTNNTASSDPTLADIHMQDAKCAAESQEIKNHIHGLGKKHVQLETDSKLEVPIKRIKKTLLPLSEVVYGALPRTDLQKAVEEEIQMRCDEQLMEEIKAYKKAIPAYVDDFRSKLNDKYGEFISPSDKEEFLSKLQAAEDFVLRDDVAELEMKLVCTANLDELKKRFDTIEERYREYVKLGPAIKQLNNYINSFRDSATKYEFIKVAAKQKVLDKCDEVEVWLREKKEQQDALPIYAPPILLSADVTKKAAAVRRFCRPIVCGTTGK